MGSFIAVAIHVYRVGPENWRRLADVSDGNLREVLLFHQARVVVLPAQLLADDMLIIKCCSVWQLAAGRPLLMDLALADVADLVQKGPHLLLMLLIISFSSSLSLRFWRNWQFEWAWLLFGLILEYDLTRQVLNVRALRRLRVLDALLLGNDLTLRTPILVKLKDLLFVEWFGIH